MAGTLLNNTIDKTDANQQLASTEGRPAKYRFTSHPLKQLG